MKIVRGFTLIELLVVMGIIAILAVIAAPNFIEMQNKVKFREDSQKFLDILGEARSNALSNKNCGNGNNSNKWTVILKKNGSNFNIYCQDSNGNTEIQSNESNFTVSSGVTRIYRLEGENTDIWVNDGDDDNSIDYLGISYLSGTSQTKIESFRDHDGFTDVLKASFDAGNTADPWTDDLNGVRRSTFRLVFEWNTKNEVITICMNGVAGFPRKLDGQTGSDEDCPPE